MNDDICWHNGGACKNPVVKVFADKRGREISVCQAHSSPYHRSEDFELVSVVVPG